ncbi:hypothetical protein ACE38V_12770 [Cytobacillus sp. Hz8]|uniref:hypothetical protein n=1 Tax=Cytobacillus sp. Hz8 TaxID=3347168 RepID=UPI0035DE2A2D
MKILNSLSTAEKRRIRKAVIPQLERYRILKSVGKMNEEQKAFCSEIEQAIEILPVIEKSLITTRYTNPEAEYMTDYKFYNNYMNPPVSEKTYNRIRDNAMFKISLRLGVETGVEISV